MAIAENWFLLRDHILMVIRDFPKINISNPLHTIIGPNFLPKQMYRVNPKHNSIFSFSGNVECLPHYSKLKDVILHKRNYLRGYLTIVGSQAKELLKNQVLYLMLWDY